MLESKASQFSLSPEGQILWQEKQHNPLPGVAVAKLEKGEHALKPSIQIIENETTNQHDQTTLKNHLNIWLKTHLQEILEPLVLLETPKGTEKKEDAVSQISKKTYDGLGIVPRENIEELIAQLTPETRVDLRAKKIRLGPVLAFIPILKKPAAVKLRALLWSLYNDAKLPAKTPADGIVSTRIEEGNPNHDFYRAISYPLYAKRAVRIDMLDRVISCIYDHAENGKFQARHEMAEWLGCTIEDLYEVIEAMGHKKIHDPADNIETENNDIKPEKTVQTKTSETESQPDDEKTKEAIKPELATFRLKKGKAFKKQTERQGKQNRKQGDKDRKTSHKKDKKHKNKQSNAPRVISIEAEKNHEDSPFAILQQLKK